MNKKLRGLLETVVIGATIMIIVKGTMNYFNIQVIIG